MKKISILIFVFGFMLASSETDAQTLQHASYCTSPNKAEIAQYILSKPIIRDEYVKNFNLLNDKYKWGMEEITAEHLPLLFDEMVIGYGDGTTKCYIGFPNALGYVAYTMPQMITPDTQYLYFKGIAVGYAYATNMLLPETMEVPVDPFIGK